MAIWVGNADGGRLVDAESATVSAFDHGFTVGDGVFETMKVAGGVPFALTRHLRRLADSAARLQLAMPADALLRSAIAETVDAAALPGTSRVRITLTGGVGPLGSDRDDTPPTLVVACAPTKTWEDTASVCVVPWVRNERSAVAGAKTTSYAENVVALAYAHERDCSEAILANTRGELCEGTGSNIFVVVDGQVLTPPLSSGCLAGITRELVVEWSGAREEPLSIDVLQTADEVFLTSSTRDVQAVGRVDDRALVAGPVTARVRADFVANAAKDIDP